MSFANFEERTMNKNLWIAAVIGLAGTAGACSSDEPSATEQQYPQPAASAGDEATPTEPDPTLATPTPALSTAAEDQPVTAVPENGMSRPGDEPVAESLRDTQILKITDLANSAEVEQAKLAKTKASDPQVKKFAAMMVKDHSAAKDDGAKLGKSANLIQEDSTVAHSLQNKSEETLATLKAVEPTAFDSAYMTAQVEQHQAVLDLLSNQLIPSATNPKLKTELEATRTVVQRHLGHAQQIQQSLATAR
jgi:putative membrane protein